MARMGACPAFMAAARALRILLFLQLHSLAMGSSKSRTHSQVALRSTAAARQNVMEVFNPPTMLLMSSTMERKVVYTQVKNFKSVGSVLPLIDAGLTSPFGIAWDPLRSVLYIADGGLRKIYRVKISAFKCTNLCKGVDYQLKADGNRFVVVEDVISQWVTVDKAGNLYFSDQETKSVSKLLAEDIEKIVDGKILVKDLKRTTETEAEGEEAEKEALADDTAVPEEKTQTTTPAPAIYELYEQKASPNVGLPAGVAVEGQRLYWTNQVGGFGSGSVSYGQTEPKVKNADFGEESRPAFPSVKFVNNTASAYGVALTTSKILFTGTTQFVWSSSKGTGEVAALTQSMLKPRGIVWDGDNTAYVADEEGNFVLSLPVGLMKPNAPTSRVVDIHSPFGLALIEANDQIWDAFVASSQKIYSKGSRSVATFSTLVIFSIIAALARR